MKRLVMQNGVNLDFGKSTTKSTYFTQLTNDVDAMNVGMKLTDDECYSLFKASTARDPRSDADCPSVRSNG